MTLAQKIDFKAIPVIEVARQLFGQESKERSDGVEKHFPITADYSSTPQRIGGSRTATRQAAMRSISFAMRRIAMPERVFAGSD